MDHTLKIFVYPRYKYSMGCVAGKEIFPLCRLTLHPNNGVFAVQKLFGSVWSYSPIAWSLGLQYLDPVQKIFTYANELLYPHQIQGIRY